MSGMLQLDMSEMEKMARVFAASGFFEDSREAAKAFVKILAGQELGLPPFFSMSNVFVINGKPSMSAGLIAAQVKGSEKYDYGLVSLTDEGCHLTFFELVEGKRCKIGDSIFTAADATAAGLTGGNWKKFPRNMMFARAMSNGARWFAPDIFNGSVYTPDELSAGYVAADYAVQTAMPEVAPGPVVEAVAAAPVVKKVAAPVGDQLDPDAPTVADPDLADIDEEPVTPPHWIADAQTRKSFWAWVKGTLKLTEDDVHAALKVEHVASFTGSKEQAAKILLDYAPVWTAEELAGMDPEPDVSEPEQVEPPTPTAEVTQDILSTSTIDESTGEVIE